MALAGYVAVRPVALQKCSSGALSRGLQRVTPLREGASAYQHAEDASWHRGELRQGRVKVAAVAALLYNDG